MERPAAAHELPEALAGIRTLLNLKSIAIPRFVVLQPGSIPRNPRTGKIRRVIDERYAYTPMKGVSDGRTIV